MADSDKNILITPNRGSTTAEPNIIFTGGDNNPVTLSVLDDGMLSFTGSAGQLFSISDSLTGTIFSVNDISGIPSIEVDDDGTVRIGEFAGNILIGTDIDNGDKLQVSGNVDVDGTLQTTDNITVGNYSTTDTGSLLLTGSIANKQAVLQCTDGNLHMDAHAGNSTYLNFFTGSNVLFGNGAGAAVAVMGSDGDLWKGSSDNSGSKYWHAGNDGSGSGLDADLLDGQQGSYYYPASNPSGYTNDQTAAEILTAIKTVDGSGSGLDADTVDGIQGASFLRSDGSNTITGVITPNTNNTRDFGSAALKFKTIYATTFTGNASTANYADLAENYRADQEYEVGTVLSFGGSWEVTQSNKKVDTRIAGVVSTAPAYLMNKDQQGEFVTPVALMGRVPCKVQGAVRKGDMLVSAGNGRARVVDNPLMGSVIGKALADSDDDNIIEVVVGKL